MSDNFGDRVVDIRQKRGGGARTAVKQPDMAKALAAAAGVRINGQRLSRIESGGEQKFYEAVAILRALKALDPEHRTYEWLIGTDPLPLKAAKPKRRLTVVEPIITRRPGKRRQKGA